MGIAELRKSSEAIISAGGTAGCEVWIAEANLEREANTHQARLHYRSQNLLRFGEHHILRLTDYLVHLRFPPSVPANTPKCPDQKRLSNALMVVQDVPTV